MLPLDSHAMTQMTQMTVISASFSVDEKVGGLDLDAGPVCGIDYPLVANRTR